MSLNFFLTTRFKWLAAAFLLFALTSCGGSDSNNDTGPTNTPGGQNGNGGGQFSIDRNTVTFNAIEADPEILNSQVVTGRVKNYQGNLFITVELPTVNGVQLVNVEITGSDQGALYIIPHQPTTLGRGVYTDSIQVNACEDKACSRHLKGSPQIIDVTYTVQEGGEYTPEVDQLIYEARSKQGAAAQSIDFTYNSATSAWVAETEYHDGDGWLTITPDSGEVRADHPATVTVAASGLEAGLYQADVILKSESGVVSKRIPVTYFIQNADVQYVSPYLGISGESAETVIRGIGFHDSDVLDVRFGSASATSFEIISDTEIIATFPALTAGIYPVSVATAPKTIVGKAELVVMDAQTYPSAAMSTSSNKEKIIFDAPRQILFIKHSSGFQRFEKITFDGDHWVQDTLMEFDRLMDINMSPDGKSLVVVTGDEIEYRDPLTLATTHTFKRPEGVVWGKAAFTSDGDLIMAPINGSSTDRLYRYHPDMNLITAISLNTHIGSTNIVVSSANRDKLFFHQMGAIGNQKPLPIWVLDASKHHVSATTSGFSRSKIIKPNRDGSKLLRADYRAVLENYDGADLNELGALTRKFENLEMSPDGTRGYVQDNVFLQIFDLTQPNDNGGFTEVGSPIRLAARTGWTRAVTISPDGNTLFVAGSGNLIIQQLQ